jgi:hypothetical protein
MEKTARAFIFIDNNYKLTGRYTNIKADILTDYQAVSVIDNDGRITFYTNKKHSKSYTSKPSN